MDKIEKVSVNGQVYELAGSGGGGGTPTLITYDELVSLRNNNSLIPGNRYRINDFVSMFIPDFIYYTSASHPFDIIVTADSNSTLLPNAQAALHEGDDYFANCDLSKWELKYSLDNTGKYSDISPDPNGKGIIYYMLDEFGNEANYDFKNVLWKIDDTADFLEEGETLLCYTFSSANELSNEAISDASLGGTASNNRIKYIKGLLGSSLEAVVMLSVGLIKGIENNEINGIAFLYSKHSLTPYIEHNRINGFFNFLFPSIQPIDFNTIEGGLEISSDSKISISGVSYSNVKCKNNPPVTIKVENESYIRGCLILADKSFSLTESISSKIVCVNGEQISYFPES